jgi:hypothetical protein
MIILMKANISRRNGRFIFNDNNMMAAETMAKMQGRHAAPASLIFSQLPHSRDRLMPPRQFLFLSSNRSFHIWLRSTHHVLFCIKLNGNRTRCKNTQRIIAVSLTLTFIFLEGVARFADQHVMLTSLASLASKGGSHWQHSNVG